MIQHEGFLQDILKDLENDTPRLIYADWLDDQGEENFANFIRLQCAYAQLEKEGHTTHPVFTHPVNKCKQATYWGCDKCKEMCEITKQFAHIFVRHGDDWFRQERKSFSSQLTGEDGVISPAVLSCLFHSPQVVNHNLLHVYRGFLSMIVADFSAIMTNIRKMVRLHPIEKLMFLNAKPRKVTRIFRVNPPHEIYQNDLYENDLAAKEVSYWVWWNDNIGLTHLDGRFDYPLMLSAERGIYDHIPEEIWKVIQAENYFFYDLGNGRKVKIEVPGMNNTKIFGTEEAANKALSDAVLYLARHDPNNIYFNPE